MLHSSSQLKLTCRNQMQDDGTQNECMKRLHHKIKDVVAISLAIVITLADLVLNSGKR